MSLKIAVVGVGKVAQQNYIPFLATQTDVELGYYNRTPEKAKQAAHEFGGQTFASLEELAAWKPTTALVLTSETSRYEIGTALIKLEVGRLFFEKPLVAGSGQAHVSEDDFHKAKEMLNLAREKQCVTAMVFNYRFFDQILSAKKIVSTRDFGEVINVAGLVHYACWSHCIDLIFHFAGETVEVAALSGTTQHEGAGIQASDVVAALRLKNGASGTLIGTAGMQFQHPLFELIFTFERGRIHLRDLDGEMEVLDGTAQCHEKYTLVRNHSRWDKYRDSFKKSLQAYLDSLRHNQPPPVPGIDGLRELQVEASLRRSIAQRRPVRLQEEFPISTNQAAEVL